jgi:sugar/nucleoside kinase (ribokinase family)
MTDATIDVLAIGNALVDVIAHADDAMLEARGIPKGSMQLIDAPAAEAVYAAMGPAVEMSGGSAANTIAGLASLGGRGAFVGKVAADQLGSIFRHDITALGVEFTTPPLEGGPPTGRCMVLVTPDAQRTMQTCLGSAGMVGPDDIDAAQIQRALYTYFEGYLWDAPPAKQAYVKAAGIAHAAGRRTALTLSDTFCVDRHRDEFLDLVDGHVDVLFANEAEITALYRTNTLEQALEAVRGRVQVAAITRSEDGAVIVTPDETFEVPAHPVARVVDTTGAGDLFAAGFLYGLTRELPLRECARIATICASEIISHMGARPETRLADLV